jgi:potassium-dependent mechanosensitive channel
MGTFMRIFVFFFLMVSFVCAAEVNEKLYDENNASSEIRKIRTSISSKTPLDTEEQNTISIQKLFLDKIETYATTPPKAPIPLYKLPAQKLTQQEFLAYFSHLATHLEKILQHEQNKEVLSGRLTSIKKNLSGLRPDMQDEILQGQLEYAYFKWKSIYNDRSLNRYMNYLQSEKPYFLKSFERTDIDLQDLEKQSNKENTQLQALYQKKVLLELRLEKETILVASQKKDDINTDLNKTKLFEELKDEDKNWRYNFVRKELETVNASISEAIQKKYHTLIFHQIKNLQNEDLEGYIIVRGIMENFSHDLSAKDKSKFVLEQKMLEWLKYEHVGDLTAIVYDFKAWMDKVYAKSVRIIKTPLFYLNDNPVGISDILMMFITIFFGFMLARFYKRRVIAAQGRISFIQKQSFKIIGNLGYYLIVVVTFGISLSNIGLDLSSLSLVAGALSVGIGFGLKEVVGNFVSGIILMAERSVRIGDYVEIDNEIVGNVTDIRMRSVTIKTSANIDIVVPNSLLVQQSFSNYTLDESVRRLSIPFTVAYGISYEEVNEVILAALEQSNLAHIRGSKAHEAELIMSGMDERGVNYTLFVFVNTYGPNARSSFFRLVYKTLQEKGLPIPAPKLDVTMLTDSEAKREG